jgi:hypothetical protein
MVEEPSHGNTLLETTRKNIAPLSLSVPTFLV